MDVTVGNLPLKIKKRLKFRHCHQGFNVNLSEFMVKLYTLTWTVTILHHIFLLTPVVCPYLYCSATDWSQVTELVNWSERKMRDLCLLCSMP